MKHNKKKLIPKKKLSNVKKKIIAKNIKKKKKNINVYLPYKKHFL